MYVYVYIHAYMYECIITYVQADHDHAPAAILAHTCPERPEALDPATTLGSLLDERQCFHRAASHCDHVVIQNLSLVDVAAAAQRRFIAAS